MSGNREFKFRNPFGASNTSTAPTVEMSSPSITITTTTTTSSAQKLSNLMATLKKPQWIGIAVGLIAGIYVVGRQYLKVRRFRRKYQDNEKALAGRSKSQKINMTWLSIYDISQLKRQLTHDHNLNFKYFKGSNVIDYQHQTYIACNPFIYEYINLVGIKEFWQWVYHQIPVSAPGTEGGLVEYNDANYQILDHYPQIAKDLEVLLNESQLHEDQIMTLDDLVEHLRKRGDFLRQLYAGGCQVPDLMRDIDTNTKKLNLWTFVKEYQHQLIIVSNYMQKEVDLLPEIQKQTFFHWCLRYLY